MKQYNEKFSTSRRQFVRVASGALAVGAIGFPNFLYARDRELVIKKIVLQEAKGRRLAPSGPNAGGRLPVKPGYDSTEYILRLQTAQGLEGICCFYGGKAKTEQLKKLIGLDPFKMFRFEAGDRIVEAAEPYQSLLADIRGVDVALIDLIGQVLKRPAAMLLGTPVHEGVTPYNSSLYMDDFLPQDALKNLVYIKGAVPKDPVELLARKAEWLTQGLPERYKAVKIKTGRGNYLPTPQAALERDIAVTNAIRKAVGPDVKILVDANRHYWGDPQLAWSYAQGVNESNIYAMEEMFPEENIVDMLEFKKRLRSIGRVKLAAGESVSGGLAKNVYTQRFQYWTFPEEPLIDIEQGDFNANGYLFLRAKAAEQAALGMTMAPHNYGSKMGFYAQVHLGVVTPNWDASEIDDFQFPALVPEGIEIKQGLAKLTGVPGLGVKLREEHLQKPSLELA